MVEHADGSVSALRGDTHLAEPLAFIEQDLDNLARKLCKVRANYICERCDYMPPQVVVQWHHIVTRRCKTLRWNMLNLLCLCKGCHHWWHEVAQLGEQWMWLERKFPGRRDKLNLILQTLPRRPKIDRALIRVELRQELAKYGHEG